jgi:hypothetical protein
MKVNVISETFGISEIIPLRQMTITFPTPTDIFFDLFLSHEADAPWSFAEFPPYVITGGGHKKKDPPPPPITEDATSMLLFPTVDITRTLTLADGSVFDLGIGSFGSNMFTNLTYISIAGGASADTWQESRIFLTYDLPANTVGVNILNPITPGTGGSTGWYTVDSGTFSGDWPIHSVAIYASSIADASEPEWDTTGSTLWTFATDGLTALFTPQVVPEFHISATPGPFQISFHNTSTTTVGDYGDGNPNIPVPITKFSGGFVPGNGSAFNTEVYNNEPFLYVVTSGVVGSVRVYTGPLRQYLRPHGELFITLVSAFASGSVRVYVDGLKLTPGVDFTEIDPLTGLILLVTAPTTVYEVDFYAYDALVPI